MKNKFCICVLMTVSLLWLNPLHAATDNPEAKALVKSLLPNEDDYLPFVKDKVENAKLKEMLANGANHTQTFDTFWTNDNGTYILMYVNLIQNGSAINSTLFVSKNEPEFNKISSEFPEGTKIGVQAGGSKLVKIEPVKQSSGYTEYYLVKDPQGKKIGNLVFVSRGKSFLMVSVFGPVVFEDAATIDKFLSGKIEKALMFKPDKKSPNFLPK
ncbi:MAG: hypothetical protein ABI644_08750 [Arenimonas sp.]